MQHATTADLIHSIPALVSYLSMLMTLKPGDVIPIHFGPEVPVMVGTDCLGKGTVGTSNGHAAVRLTHLDRIDDEGLDA